MIPAAFGYQIASDADAAAALLRKHGEDAKIISGGMSLIPLMKMRLAQPSVLVDIGRIAGLDYVRLEGGRLRIGALVRHVDLVRNQLIRDNLPLLAKVAEEVGDTQVRARGTIGGVFAHADSAGDYCTLGVMLGAQVVTTKRTIAAVDFFVDFMTTPLEDDEIITEISFPVENGPHEYIKFRRRRSDWAIVGLGAQRTDQGWRIGLTNVASKAIRSEVTERALADGASAAEAAVVLSDAITPLGDFTTPVEYKKELARVLTERALRRLGVK